MGRHMLRKVPLPEADREPHLIRRFLAVYARLVGVT